MGRPSYPDAPAVSNAAPGEQARKLRVIVGAVHVQETRHVRRFVVRIEPGEDVVASVVKLARAESFRAGWARGRGVLGWADVASWDDARRAWRAARHLEGPLSATLEGTISTRIGEPTVEIDAVLGREAGTVGGRLVAGAALSIELLLEVFEDVRLERQDDDALGMAVWRADRVPGVVARARPGSSPPAAPPTARSEPAASEARSAVGPPAVVVAPAQEVPAEGSAPLSWAAVAEASAQRERVGPAPTSSSGVAGAGRPASFTAPSRSGETTDEHVPQRGDWVEHRQFGLCLVEGEDPDGGTRVRLPSGARKTLRLDVMEVLAPRHEANRTVFPVRPRGR